MSQSSTAGRTRGWLVDGYVEVPSLTLGSRPAAGDDRAVETARPGAGDPTDSAVEALVEGGLPTVVHGRLGLEGARASTAGDLVAVGE